MKRPSATACLALGGAMLASLSSTPASGRDYYMMICRTGGEMSGAIPASGVAGVPSDQTVISISFRKASAAYSASADTTRPGECAWTDRAINTSEPDNIRFSLNTRLRVTFRNTDREALVFDSVGTEGGTQVNTIMKTLMEVIISGLRRPTPMPAATTISTRAISARADLQLAACGSGKERKMRKSTLAIIACALVCASASAQTSPNQQDQQTQDPQIRILRIKTPVKIRRANSRRHSHQRSHRLALRQSDPAQLRQCVQRK